MAWLVFDYDGTLHESMRVYAPAFRAVFDQMVRDGAAQPRQWRDEEISRWLGLPAAQMWQEFAPWLPEARRQAYSRMLGGHMMQAVAAGQARLYPGAAEALETLKEQGHRLLLLSNCSRVYLTLHQTQFALDRYFDALYCAEDFGWAPKEEIFSRLRPQYPGPAIAIGDRRQDRALARANGLAFLACAYGYGTPEELAGADAVITHASQLPQAIARLTAGTETGPAEYHTPGWE